MSNIRRSIAAVAVAVLGLAVVPAAAGAEGGTTAARRLYLLASDSNVPYWSVDANDPELDAGPLAEVSGPTISSPTERFAQMTFMPASVFTAPVAFGPTAPLRFHVALEVAATGPYEVRLALQRAGLPELRSAPGVEVAPGIWEGTLAEAGVLGGGGLDMLVVRVTSMSPAHRMELSTGGASWVDLPRPSPALSVPQLLERSPRPTVPTTFTSATRSITFNDDQWAVRSFTGTLDAARTFTVTEDRHAVAVMAWVDAPDTPPLSEPLHGRVPNPRSVGDVPTMSLTLDGASLDTGNRSVAAVDVGTGELGVRAGGSATTQALPYTVHVLSVYGQRTLRQMRWRFPATGATAFGALGGVCGSYQGVPVTSSVTSFVVDVDASSPNPTSADGWTPMYDIPGFGEAPCGQSGRGSELRMTFPGQQRRWRIGATPQRRTVPVVAFADTMLELEVRWAYAPVE